MLNWLTKVVMMDAEDRRALTVITVGVFLLLVVFAILGIGVRVFLILSGLGS